MPQRVSIRRTRRVACTRSFSAPVDTSPTATSSAHRPPGITSTRASSHVRL